MKESEMQFCIAVEEFLRFCALERQLSAHTLAAYRADLNDFGKWIGGSTQAARAAADVGADAAVPDISTAALKDYLEDMVGARKLAVATVRRRFACLRAFFRRAAARDGVADPFANWRPLLPRRKRLPRTLSRGETRFLLAGRAAIVATRGDGNAPFRTIVQLLVVTGMRVGELCRLRLDDVAPDGSVLRIHGKGARDRVAYVTDAGLRLDLRRIVEERRRPRADGGVAALFLNRHGAPLRPQSVRAKLKRLADEAGLGRRVTPHMLRHTAATLLIETGVDIRFVQRLLGHSSIATTEIYTHVSDEALRRTLERADVLGGLAAG
jgi:site-specific recombinase XerD